ncbi:hypothetical protein NP493_96g13047 [Ridgeia piscesae]|uniref:Uncharacterized protein n=1 Tax=Ridgeia piscesae TaxID=27915 RepID=A0AAD9P7Z2_RIDPI|nr:hypothetical protein NP493_96g13047 [Ridgeia piscesae]
MFVCSDTVTVATATCCRDSAGCRPGVAHKKWYRQLHQSAQPPDRSSNQQTVRNLGGKQFERHTRGDAGMKFAVAHWDAESGKLPEERVAVTTEDG